MRVVRAGRGSGPEDGAADAAARPDLHDAGVRARPGGRAPRGRRRHGPGTRRTETAMTDSVDPEDIDRWTRHLWHASQHDKMTIGLPGSCFTAHEQINSRGPGRR